MSSPPTVPGLAAIRRRLELSSRTFPWEFSGGDIYPQRVFGRNRHGERVLIAETFVEPRRFSAEADAEFIAHAPSDIAALLTVADAANDACERGDEQGLVTLRAALDLLASVGQSGVSS